MNQTIMFNRRFHPEWAHSLKSFCMTLGCVLMLIGLGTTKSSGQTMIQVPESISAHVINLIQGETSALELELKYPSSSIETDYNDVLVVYYNSVVKKFRSGEDIKVAFKDIDYIRQHTSHDSAVELHPNGQVNLLNGSDVLELYSLVGQLDLEDGDDSDIEAVFTFWRTVKNR